MPDKKLLFCLPHAGGSAEFFLPLGEHLPVWLRLCPLERPGRGRRANEPLLIDFERLLEDAAGQIRAVLEREDYPRYGLFGHSMGALLAYDLVRMLPIPPCHLFLSSPPRRACQDFPARREAAYALPHEHFFNVLRTLGGLPEEVLASPELMRYVEPILRADFTALETWAPALPPPLSLPFTCFNGSEETGNRCSDWAARTTGPFAAQYFSGGHFYLTAHWKALATAIAQACGQDNPR